jgi:hypothetical protein
MTRKCNGKNPFTCPLCWPYVWGIAAFIVVCFVGLALGVDI